MMRENTTLPKMYTPVTMTKTTATTMMKMKMMMMKMRMDGNVKNVANNCS